MSIDPRVVSLLVEWEGRRAAGEPATPEELCRDCPELLAEVRRQLGDLARVNRLLDLGNSADGIDRGACNPPYQPASETRPASAGPRSLTVDPRTASAPADRPAADAPGRRLGPYEVRRTLGAGGMGVVLAAFDPHLRREVAVKVMRPDVADPRSRSRFLREAQSAAALHHDHVVPVYHVGEADGAPYIVMPLLAGESLRARLDRGPLAPADVLKLAREALAGLAAAHDRGLVHRDIKPSNLWLETVGDGWRVKVLDFGLARPAAEDPGAISVPGAVVGTPNYMSPEQANGRPVDARTDLFSLGAVLYEAATGARAFAGTTTTAALVAVASHDPPPAHAVNPAVPPALSAFIARLLAKDPTARPASAAAALADLPADVSGEPTAPYVPTVTQGRRRRPLWSFWPWVAAGALLLVAAARLVEVATRDRRPPAAPAAVTYRGTVDLLVLRTNALGEDDLLPLADPRALPLKLGDRFRIEAEVEPAAHVYVFWIDVLGRADPVYPWKSWDEVGTPADDRPVPRVSLPVTAGNGFKFRPTATGLETLVLLARPTPLTASADELRGWFGGLPDGRPLPSPTYRAWFEGFRLVKGDPKRAAPTEDADLGLPAYRLQGTLQPRLAGQAGLVRAVSFATVAELESVK